MSSPKTPSARPPKRPGRRPKGTDGAATPAASSYLSLISRWFLRPSNEEAGWAALRELAQTVYANEPGTLTYLIHAPYLADSRLQSLPPIDPISVEFFEVYRDADAFLAHVNGAVFKQFVQQHGALFAGPGNPSNPGDPMNQHPFTTVEFMTLQAGFSRPGTLATGPRALASSEPNQHPAVMFEIMANNQSNLASFYSNVFGWQLEPDSAGFDLIPFPPQFRALLGGIGEAQPGVPGYEKGITFYFEADDLEARLALIAENGGSQVGEITTLDGYTFVNFTDSEGNLMGMIQPFSE